MDPRKTAELILKSPNYIDTLIIREEVFLYLPFSASLLCVVHTILYELKLVHGLGSNNISWQGVSQVDVPAQVHHPVAEHISFEGSNYHEINHGRSVTCTP